MLSVLLLLVAISAVLVDSLPQYPTGYDDRSIQTDGLDGRHGVGGSDDGLSGGIGGFDGSDGYDDGYRYRD